MNITLKILLLSVAVGIGCNAKGQINQVVQEYPNHTISVQPLYLFNAGLRLEYEKQLRSPREWLQINVTGYSRGSDENFRNYESFVTSNSDFDDINKLRGFGVGAGYKYFMKKMPDFYWNGLKPYFNITASYTHFNVNHSQWGYNPFKEDGLTYYEYKYFDKLSKFDRINSSFNIGFQSSMFSSIFYDLFVGIGYSHSFYKKEDKAFTHGMYSYGYRGFQFNAGGRIGVCF